ncbi:MAG: hypothetical protein U0Y82_00155 [Thermoleophilia bacterium]
MVLDGRNGSLIPPDDVPALVAALERLLSDPLEANRMAQQARAVAHERFDIATQAGSWPACTASGSGRPHEDHRRGAP